jgi:translation initiation factor 1
MTTVCPKCGLQKALCVCETLAKEQEKVTVTAVKRRYNKYTTRVEGLSKDVEPRKILKELKTRLACGGTLKDGVIELQGDHRERVKPVLVKLGFPEERIEIY